MKWALYGLPCEHTEPPNRRQQSSKFKLRHYRKVFAESEIISNPRVVRDWCEAIYNAKGQSYGVSGQATQTIPGGSSGALAGGQSAAQLQAAAYNQQLNQLYNGGLGQQSNANWQHIYQQQLAAIQAIQQQANAKLAPEKPIEPLKTEGFKLGEIIAWRGWKLTPSGFLKSMSAEVIWAPDEPMDGKTQSTKEHNGIYAFKKAKDFLHEMESAGLDVYGRVALWGDVIEHELGYRAEFAKVVSIDHYLKLKAPHAVPIKELRERYHVEAA